MLIPKTSVLYMEQRTRPYDKEEGVLTEMKRRKLTIVVQQELKTTVIPLAPKKGRKNTYMTLVDIAFPAGKGPKLVAIGKKFLSYPPKGEASVTF